jgi:hypothetical protein
MTKEINSPILAAETIHISVENILDYNKTTGYLLCYENIKIQTVEIVKKGAKFYISCT